MGSTIIISERLILCIKCDTRTYVIHTSAPSFQFAHYDISFVFLGQLGKVIVHHVDCVFLAKPKGQGGGDRVVLIP